MRLLIICLLLIACSENEIRPENTLTIKTSEHVFFSLYELNKTPYLFRVKIKNDTIILINNGEYFYQACGELKYQQKEFEYPKNRTVIIELNKSGLCPPEL